MLLSLRLRLLPQLHLLLQLRFNFGELLLEVLVLLPGLLHQLPRNFGLGSRRFSCSQIFAKLSVLGFHLHKLLANSDTIWVVVKTG